MAIIAVLNAQPGVGTTTTALNLLAAIAQRGQRPLGIDLDPAGDLTSVFGARPEHAADSVFAFLRNHEPLGNVAQITRSGIVLCPAHADLARLDAELGKGIDAVTRLRRALRRPNAVTGPVVIDCGPRLDVLALNALFACELLLVPVAADEGAVQAAERVERAAAALEPVLKGRLARRYLRTRSCDSPADEEGGAGSRLAAAIPAGMLCRTRIRERPEVGESRVAGLDVFRHAPGSAGAEDYLALVDELAGAGFLA